MSGTNNTPSIPNGPVKNTIYSTIGVLVVVAVLSFLLRSWVNNDEHLPSGDSAWHMYGYDTPVVDGDSCDHLSVCAVTGRLEYMAGELPGDTCHNAGSHHHWPVPRAEIKLCAIVELAART